MTADGFDTADYVVCGISLCISISIGLYYALAGGRQRTSQDYHIGNRNLSVIPVMFSLLATTQSSILIVGLPAEIYMYSVIALLGGPSSMLAYLIGSRIIVPIVHPLKITSVNEYFELRYGSRLVRLFMTFLTIFFWVMYIGILTFGIATAIESIVGIPMWISLLVVSCASMVYTSIGGIKAVVWTDVFQCLIMFSGLFAVLIQGTLMVGGATEVLRINSEGERLAFWNFSFDPRVRYTIWNMLIGNTVKVLAFPLQQSTAQRVACMPTIENAYRMFHVVGPFLVLIISLAGAQGLVAYAYYSTKHCDPLAAKMIKNPNQLVPNMVAEIFAGIPGMSGLFVSGLICATLSTASSGYAALSSITLHDIIKLKYKNISETRGAIASKITVVVCCAVTTAVAYFIGNVKGSLMKMGLSLLPIPMAPYSGVFLYSVFCTSATTAGALTGGITSLLFYAWMSIGQTFSDLPSLNKPLSPASVDMCHYNHSMVSLSNESVTHSVSYLLVTTTPNITHPVEKELQGLPNLYSVSFQWFDAMAIIIAITLGLIVSKIVGPPHEDEIDVRYVLSFWEQYFPCLPAKTKYYLSCCSNIGERRQKYFQEQQETEIDVPILLDEKVDQSANGKCPEAEMPIDGGKKFSNDIENDILAISSN